MPNQSRPATLKSMATELGLHVSTVSRVLNGDPTGVERAASAEVIARIRALAKELDYRPNTQASNLKLRKSQEICVLMPRLTDLVMATIYDSIDSAAEQAGYLTFVSNTDDQQPRQMARAEHALRRSVAGLIVGDSHTGDTQPLLDLLARKQIPYVLVSRQIAGHLTAACDDELGGWLAAEHLYRLGCREVAILAGERHASTGADRTRGFIRYYREQGISLRPEWILNGPFDSHTGHQQGAYLLALNPRPQAFFAVNDFLAIGLMGAARDKGLQPGKDIAVVGYNDIPLANELIVPLSSVRLPLAQMGRQAVELLLKRINGESAESTILTPQLQARASSAVLPKAG
ncbi:LacI family DNA-binding transcriptional regulator [Pseudomonas vancouverensis]|uniref:LacI family DNA-binding transcriptional regulator n=1 Tax=Pseudomonas vancouverensis TaxID=95300 RepID=A0A1H2MI69_PSEVA|nr:LacI family DNA-binding transcriptional regulator [Pseudomonas vancouverensis]KAB0489337.1 substrate-binding domain-containing protein [Pseudomonas vancouverensis]TDB56393.1 LacI family DNA-binding transcriptional regulator [Pseudomonas vancouverensis]SDU92879.1 transcriptional regulator, LacI family [Pseudomonas vancouverensis]